MELIITDKIQFSYMMGILIQQHPRMSWIPDNKNFFFEDKKIEIKIIYWFIFLPNTTLNQNVSGLTIFNFYLINFSFIYAEEG